MAIATLLLIVVVFFHREIIVQIGKFCMKGESVDFEPWTAPVLAQLRLEAKFYIGKSPFIESFSIHSLIGPHLFIQKELWEQFDQDEKLNWIAWSLSACVRTSAFERLFWKSKIQTLDRDIALMTQKPLALSPLLKKVIQYRTEFPPTALGSLFSGLSFLGSSILIEWPTHDERLRDFAGVLAQLNKSQ